MHVSIYACIPACMQTYLHACKYICMHSYLNVGPVVGYFVDDGCTWAYPFMRPPMRLGLSIHVSSHACIQVYTCMRIMPLPYYKGG